MSPMQTSEAFVVGYSPVATAGRVARARSRLKGNFISLGLLVAVGVVLWFTSNQPDRVRYIATTMSIGAVIWVGYLVWRLLSLRAARKDLARVPSGEALRFDHQGIRTADPALTIAWPQVVEVRAAGRTTGAGPDLQIEYAGGSYAVPLSFLDAMPGSIDSAMRAYSGGRRGLNLSALDNTF